MPLSEHLTQFPKRRILVIGDVILDHYVRGSVTRVSPEAPVPILRVEEDEWLPGGAANVARNLTTLGARADLVGLVGKDEAGATLTRLLRADRLLRAHLISEKNHPTIRKTRCVAQGQQMLRLDREVVKPPAPATRTAAMRAILRLMATADGVILSDYGKGFLQHDLLRDIIAAARKRKLPVLVDPKGHDYTRYRGVTVITPNQKEAAEAAGTPIHDEDSLTAAARVLLRNVASDAVVITRGAHGVSVFPKRGKPAHIPAKAREVFDVTGAGDTFIAVLALALCSGGDIRDAAALGNLAGGIVVGLEGVACVSPEALRSVCEGGSTIPRKHVGIADLDHLCRSLRHRKQRIAFTNGCFDLLHSGHVRLLDKARRLGDCLIVAINSDASTERLKGPPRPILKEKERIDLLSSISSVDHIVVFDEDTPENLLRRIRPDVLVKGGRKGDAPVKVVGRSIVEKYGGRVALLEVDDSTRTSSIIKRASARAGKRRNG